METPEEYINRMNASMGKAGSSAESKVKGIPPEFTAAITTSCTATITCSNCDGEIYGEGSSPSEAMRDLSTKIEENLNDKDPEVRWRIKNGRVFCDQACQKGAEEA